MKHRTLIAAALTLALASPMAFAGETHKADKSVVQTTTEATMPRPDAWVLTKVKTQFASSNLVDATDINVDVKDGIVHLHGTVANSAEKQEAIRIAQSTEGVKSVQAMLTVSNDTQGARDTQMPKSK